MGSLWARSGSMEFDNSGVIAPGALAYFYEAETTTPKAVYQDGDESVAHEFPLEADGNGRWPAVYVPFGTYKVRITTAAGAAIGSTIDNIPNAAPTDPSDTVDENALLTTGDIFFSFKNGTRAGAVRCNGRTIGSAASGGTERANADTEDLFAFLWTNLSDTLAPVSGGRGGSAAADFAANKTITLPDMRCAAPMGLADMGSTTSTAFDGVIVTLGAVTDGGSILGANTHLLLDAEITVHNHAISLTSGTQSALHSHAISFNTDSQGAHTHTINITDPGHSHTTSSSNLSGTKANEADAGTAGAGYMNTGTLSTGSNTTGVTAASVSNGAHTHAVSGTSGTESGTHTHEVSGNTGNHGGSTAHNNTPLAALGTWYIRL